MRLTMSGLFWAKTPPVSAPQDHPEAWYSQAIRVHLNPALGHIPLARLSPQTIQDFYDSLLRKSIIRGKLLGGNLPTLSRTTVRHIANLFHLALEGAVKRGLIARNPVDQTDPPSRETKTPTTLTPEQLSTFLRDARETAPINLWVLYLTMAGTGMRFGELLGIRETDLDLEHGLLTVGQTLKRPGPDATFGKPKTDKSRRTITLPTEIIDALRQLRRWRVEQKLHLGSKFRDYSLVFCLPSGKPLHQNNIRRKDLYPRLLRLGLPRIRPHDLRHTHGTQLIAAGVDPRTVADRLGHSSPAFTMSVYVHGVPESQRRAAEIANDLLTIPGRSAATPSRGNP
jgi:integrase